MRSPQRSYPDWRGVVTSGAVHRVASQRSNSTLNTPWEVLTVFLCADGILAPNERLLVPDADVLLNFIDFIEKDDSIDNCLILSSVLNKVGDLSQLGVICCCILIAPSAGFKQHII